jgi:hypothetical protein
MGNKKTNIESKLSQFYSVFLWPDDPESEEGNGNL